MPVIAEYEPDTQRNVPKYFTPMAASEMLIAKPTKHKRSPAPMKGERILSVSEAIAKTMSMITACSVSDQADERLHG